MPVPTTDYDRTVTAVAKMIPYVPYNLLSVSTHIEKAFTYSSLAPYSFKERLLIRFTSQALYFLFHTLGRTLPYETEGLEYLYEIESDGLLPIYCFWHD